MKKITTLLLSLFIGSAGVYAQQPTTVKGQRFEITTRTVSRAENKVDNENIYQFRLLSKQGGNSIYECKLVKVKMRENGQGSYGASIILNTDSIRKMTYNTSGIFMPLAILQQPLKVTIAANGKLVSIEGVTEAINKAAAAWGLGDEMKQQLLNNSAGGYPANEIRPLFLQLPDKKIGYGVAWKTTDPVWNYKVTGIKGALLSVSSSNEIEDGKTIAGINGNYTYNDVTGLIEQGEVISKYTVNPDAPKPINIDAVFTQNVRYNVNEYKLDTAWLNMAIVTSFWSNGLKKGAEYDSAKVYGYFKAHDALYKNDPYYRLTKIGLIQQFRSDKAYQAYDSMLVETPTHFLRGSSSHLHNKIGSVLNLGADSSYEVSKYMYKDESFDNWIQHSFAQDFLDRDVPIANDEGYRKAMLERGWKNEDITKLLNKLSRQLANANDLIKLFHTSKIPEIRQKTEALYLWVNAKQQKKDPAVLVKTANEFKKMSDLYLKQGNGNRYALIVYNMLIDAKKPKEAEALLAKTIASLEKFTADTFNFNRFADKNMLAYAYYRQYQAAKPADSVKALQYLSKAAQYSPKNNKEKAYSSFYDRVFLADAKETYREVFMEKLFKNDNTTEALNIFVDHINVNPEQIDEMEKIYHTYFPKENFKKFFADKIVTNWEVAPSFILKGLDGKDHNLADYKNKWLVLDFWGTWCGPCRAEMPRLNEFNKEIAAGKHNGIAFLSIACNDSEDKVKSYIDFNKFEIPVVMSDAEVQKQYKIRGYPSKILVSPDGKMLSVNFGAEWDTVVTKFNQLYTAAN
ncbi:hypothetical protein GCM10023149_48110 [Mucilaginibacter gynuensis]|uniref:Thioredoxin domain-containing protein n=1 Tax=Mucilaginibacter gynuensis TaxID=1302236 RepID=A0ABP8HEH2_9SPHI